MKNLPFTYSHTILRCEGYISPPDNVEYFMGQIFEFTKANGGHRLAALLLDRYRSEFAMLGIPGFVRKLIMLVQLTVVRLTGGLRKFADAPAPVTG